MDFRETYSANKFAKLALEYSANCSKEQNQLRQENGARPNVRREYEEAKNQGVGSAQSDKQGEFAAPTTA